MGLRGFVVLFPYMPCEFNVLISKILFKKQQNPELNFHICLAEMLQGREQIGGGGYGGL